MTPEEIYGHRAGKIIVDGRDDQDDCWHWCGDVGQINGKGPLVPRDGRRWNVLRVGLTTAGVIAPGSQESAARACLTERCMNPEHYATGGSEVALMVYIRERTRPQDGCEVWEGTCNPGGFPVMRTDAYGGNKLAVRKFLYEVEHDVKLSVTHRVVTKCNTHKCVKLSHLKLSVPEPAAPRATEVDPVSETLREHARLFMMKANATMMREYA